MKQPAEVMANDYPDPWNRPRNKPQPWQLPGPITTLTLGLILGILCYQAYLTFQDRFQVFGPRYDAIPRPITPRGDLGQDEQTTIDIYNHSRESVVHITSQVLRSDRWSMDVLKIPAGTGTGFVWDERGFIVTNYHVIKGAQNVEVTMAGEKNPYTARVVGIFPDSDLAVLQIASPGRKFTPLPIGASNDLKVGQKVFAIGNPFGLDQTLTTGIISALDRSLQGEDGTILSNLIQTDAAINPGNSGGPLLDSAGRLIGVNTAIISPGGGSAGVGFAIPVDQVNKIVPELIRSGRVLGSEIEGLVYLSDQKTAQLRVKGVMIYRVRPGSAAEEAGLEGIQQGRRGLLLGDLILSCDGTETNRVQELESILRKKKPGEEAVLVVLSRDGTKRTVTIPVSEPDSRMTKPKS